MSTFRPALRAARFSGSACGIVARRHFSATAPSRSAAAADAAAAKLLADFSATTVTRRQVLDANQLQKLSLTLGRRTLYGGAGVSAKPSSNADLSETPPADGTPLPAGYHLVYFTPNGVEGDLGKDGTDKTFNAQPPFTRRMWAGGQMQWHADARLRVGDAVEERTRLVRATPKSSRSAGEMVLVEVEKEFWGPRGLALVDTRSWIFRPEVSHTLDATKPRKEAAPFADVHAASSLSDETTSTFPRRTLHWSPVGLFRFSALTFNGHKIHYNETWAGDIEDHAGTVVHGPLNLISILDYWRDVHSVGSSETLPGQIAYRAMAPIYAGEKYAIETASVGEPEDGGSGKTFEILATKGGVVCMKSEVVG